MKKSLIKKAKLLVGGVSVHLALSAIFYNRMYGYSKEALLKQLHKSDAVYGRYFASAIRRAANWQLNEIV